eukprot:4788940-Lingulodinium_polyedra.AAC.1
MESAKPMLRFQAGAFVQGVGSMPILVSYSSDGSVVKTGHSVLYAGPKGRKAFLKARKGMELF